MGEIKNMKLEDLHRVNLKKVYKFVKICLLCKQEYGVDNLKERSNPNTCPVCVGNIRKTGNFL